MKISIKKYIILLLIIFTLLPFVLLRIVAYPKINSDLKTVIMDNLRIIGHKQTELVTTWMRERMKDAIVVASNPYMANSVNFKRGDGNFENTLQYLEKVVAEYGYKGAFVADAKGIVTVATVEDNIGRDISKTDYFKHAIEGRTYASSIMPSDVPLINEYEEKEVGLPTMFVTTPVKGKEDAIIGVVALRIHVGMLSNLLQSYKFGKTGETFLVNSEGYMLTESRFTDQLKNLGLIKTRSALELKLLKPGTNKLTYGVEQCIAGNNGSDAKGYTDYAGISVLGVWNWLPEFNWGVVTEIDRGEAYGAAYNLKYIVTALLLAIAFPIVVVAYFVGKKFSYPIIHLTEITEKMAAGDLTQRADITSREDEIGVLATSFNTMADNLAKKKKETEESEKRYREIFDYLQAGIYQCEPGTYGVFTWVNQACAEMFGYKSPEEMIGTTVKDIYVDPEDRERLVKKLETEGVWKDFRSLCKKKNGETFNTERTSNLIRDAEGKSVRIVGVIREISKGKLADSGTKKPE
ncbi:MAG: PAS domain S-box protein [Candidatus Scalindua sp.]|nr:PAS domain S-box protein [Candidatus Scalindua sp.]